MLALNFNQRNWMIGVFLFCAVVVFGNGLHYLLFRLLRKKGNVGEHGARIKEYIERPARAVFLVIAVRIVLPFVPGIPKEILSRINQLVEVLLVLSLGWLAVGGVYLFQAIMLRRFDITQADNLRARRLHTQVQFLRRVLIGAVVVLTAVALLWSMHNPGLWKYGTGLLASAGLASLLLAAAAKSTASNLLAGLQIALSEPIRIDDVVVIEGEWGRIAEITSTYVVVKIWDERTQIVPLSYFIEKPFTNWTRTGSSIMGTAFLYVDYAVPVQPLREALNEIARGSDLWDQRVCGLQVTNLSEQTMELRCLVSSSDSGKNFDLCCLVREQMIDYLREHYPASLPRTRVELQSKRTEEEEETEQRRPIRQLQAAYRDRH